MLINLLILAFVLIGIITIAKRRELIQICALLFFIAQLGFAAWVIINRSQTTLQYFTFDVTGITFYVLMSLVGMLTIISSITYLDNESIRQHKIYFTSLIALSLSLTGLYFANNIAVGWIFLEATTIATAGLTYHRRTPRALEATWKYIFVSSVGIAIAYLGILLLESSMTNGSHLFYNDIMQNISGANIIYGKIAFLLILVGYSAKLEIFPLFTVGIDANHATPSPASAFLSSALVGGGVISLLRLYHAIEPNVELFSWVKNVLMITAILSLVVSAVYLGRTNNYKRLLAYSTVENSSIVLLGLAISGIGVWAAVLHALSHFIIKPMAFIQLSTIGKIYGTYKVGKIGNYFKVDPIGALALMLVLIALIAVPPSILFQSEFIILSELTQKPLAFIIVALSIITIIYWLVSKILPILYKSVDISKTNKKAKNNAISIIVIMLTLTTLILGIYLAPELQELVSIISQHSR